MYKKVILITGASSGIGNETAKRLIQEGYAVYPTAPDVENMQDLKAAGAFPMKMDVTSSADIDLVVDTILAKEERIDVLWNNAGIGLYGAIEDVPMEDARKVLEVDLVGTAALIQKVLPFMRKAKSGLILNTSSMAGKMYVPLGGWYHGAKHAIEGMSDCLRLEVKPFNIKVVLLEPGAIDTNFGSATEKYLKKYGRDSAYKNLYDKVKRNQQKGTVEGGASHPSVIADVVSKIIKSNNPKTRYAAGKMAKPSIFLRTYLSDRLFDKVIMSQMK